jgi:hypothetical protein
LKSDKIWTIWKKDKMNSEMIWKIWKKSKLKSEKNMDNMEVRQVE